MDLSLYRRIGEEVTRIVKHKPGMLYVKEIIRPKYVLKDHPQLPPEGQKGVEMAPMPLMPVDKCIAGAFQWMLAGGRNGITSVQQLMDSSRVAGC